MYFSVSTLYNRYVCFIVHEVHDHPSLSSFLAILCSLPYMMVFAVASMDSVYFYNTQQHTPFGYVTSIHYANLTDLTWSVRLVKCAVLLRVSLVISLFYC